MTSPHSDASVPGQRLDAITTCWTMVRKAHAAGQEQEAAEARQALVVRYATSVRHYLGRILGNRDDADEIAQEVVVRLLSGDFAGADPERGRFRDLLKTAVINMARKHWAKEGRRRTTDLPIDLADDSETDDHWDEAWRRTLLDHAWASLASWEKEHPKTPTYTLLKLRTDFPDDTSDQLAARLSEATGTVMRAPACRQALRRARLRFVEIIADEVKVGLDDPTPQRVQEELAAVGLLPYVRDLLLDDWK